MSEFFPVNNKGEGVYIQSPQIFSFAGEEIDLVPIVYWNKIKEDWDESKALDAEGYMYNFNISPYPRKSTKALGEKNVYVVDKMSFNKKQQQKLFERISEILSNT